MGAGITNSQIVDEQGLLRYKNFELDHDDIQFLIEGANPKKIDVIAAPGANRLIRFVGAVITSDLTEGVYTLDGSYLLGFAADGGLVGGFPKEDGDEAFPLIPDGQAVSITASLLPEYSKGGDGTATADLINKAVYIQNFGAATSISGGHVNNTVKGIIEYRILDTVTMKYV